MRPARPLALAVVAVALAACSSSTPGWTLAPEPSITPPPSVDPSASAAASAAASADAGASASAPASGEPSASGSAAPSDGGSGTVLQLTAQTIAFDKTELSAPADQAFQIEFVNNDAGVPHDVDIRDAAGATISDEEIVTGVVTQVYDIDPLPAGSYTFVCSVHPNMTGTLTAG